MSSRPFAPIAFLGVLLVWCGCTGAPSRLAQPGVNRNAGKDAVAAYDKDGDGAISGDELDSVPALKKTLSRVDTNGDGRITAEEIDQRVAAWSRSQVALTRVVATVLQNGRPVSDAQVTLVPEQFLGASVKPATGTTDFNGRAHLKISNDPDENGVHLGYYRIEVSKKGPDGQETIPARYNTETELGAEVTMDDPNSDRLSIDLK